VPSQRRGIIVGVDGQSQPPRDQPAHIGYPIEVSGVLHGAIMLATPAEKARFVVYGAASSIYRVLVSIFIALFIAGRFFIIGVLVACLRPAFTPRAQQHCPVCRCYSAPRSDRR
jgi:hypothetical protein